MTTFLKVETCSWAQYKISVQILSAFTHNQRQRRSCCRPRDLQITATHFHLVSKDLRSFLPEDGTPVPTRVSEAHLIFVLISNVNWLYNTFKFKNSNRHYHHQQKQHYIDYINYIALIILY